MSVKVTSFVPQAIDGNTEGTLKGILETAIKVTTQAKLLAPVKKGQLKGSIMWKSDKLSGGYTEGNKLTESVKPLQVIVGTAVEHGIYQEFGTRKMGPQPFLRPSIDIVTNGLGTAQAMAKSISDSVERKV